MGDIDKIKLKHLLNMTESKNIEVMNLYKALQINLGQLDVKNEELIELINYFEKFEEYEICNKLKRKLK